MEYAEDTIRSLPPLERTPAQANLPRPGPSPAQRPPKWTSAHATFAPSPLHYSKRTSSLSPPSSPEQSSSASWDSTSEETLDSRTSTGHSHPVIAQRARACSNPFSPCYALYSTSYSSLSAAFNSRHASDTESDSNGSATAVGTETGESYLPDQATSSAATQSDSTRPRQLSLPNTVEVDADLSRQQTRSTAEHSASSRRPSDGSVDLPAANIEDINRFYATRLTDEND